MTDTNVVKFDPTPNPMEPDREILFCLNCGSRTYKVTAFNKSGQLHLECANCERRATDFIITEVDDP